MFRQGAVFNSQEERALKYYAKRYALFLERLRRAREESGLTQVEVARRLSRPQSYVSKCESGERRIDVIELEQFAILYRKAVNYFIP
jgi:transcriptional regulator with XRE-family HTH domain